MLRSLVMKRLYRPTKISLYRRPMSVQRVGDDDAVYRWRPREDFVDNQLESITSGRLKGNCGSVEFSRRSARRTAALYRRSFLNRFGSTVNRNSISGRSRPNEDNDLCRPREVLILPPT